MHSLVRLVSLPLHDDVLHWVTIWKRDRCFFRHNLALVILVNLTDIIVLEPGYAGSGDATAARCTDASLTIVFFFFLLVSLANWIFVLSTAKMFSRAIFDEVCQVLSTSFTCLLSDNVYNFFFFFGGGVSGENNRHGFCVPSVLRFLVHESSCPEAYRNELWRGGQIFSWHLLAALLIARWTFKVSRNFPRVHTCSQIFCDVVVGAAQEKAMSLGKGTREARRDIEITLSSHHSLQCDVAVKTNCLMAEKCVALTKCARSLEMTPASERFSQFCKSSLFAHSVVVPLGSEKWIFRCLVRKR